MEKLLNRINELARKAKTADGLTETEKIEQKELRQQYLRSFRSSFDDILFNLYRFSDIISNTSCLFEASISNKIVSSVIT